VATARGVTGKDEAFEGGASTLGPKLGAERQAMAESNGLKAVLDRGSHPDQADAVGDEGAQVPCAGIRNPDSGAAIVWGEIEQVPSVATISLCLTDDHRSDLRRLADEDGVPEAVHHSMKPLGVPGGLDPDRHWRTQGPIEALHGVTLVEELLLENLAGGGVEDGDLLLSRGQITSNETHESGLLFGGRVTVPQPNPINSGRPFS